MQIALRMAAESRGHTSPNPMVGAVLVKNEIIIGKGRHKRAGLAHAEIEAISSARHPHLISGATLYVTLEPCSTFGRTPPCTSAIIQAGISRVVIAATDPNPAHAGNGIRILENAGISVACGILEDRARELNEAFNHWITTQTPFVTIKSALSIDGKTATESGQSKWITDEPARAAGMRLRYGVDAILVGVRTVIADNPTLTARLPNKKTKMLRRIVLDPLARTPADAILVNDEFRAFTNIIISKRAPAQRVAELSQKAGVIEAPETEPGRLDLQWLMRRLGGEKITSLLIEGGGETTGAFIDAGLVNKAVFFYAPKILCGASAPRAVAGTGITRSEDIIRLDSIKWRRLGSGIMLSGTVNYPHHI
ncbi:MAG: bifunctional diaminohydroxyphosphoribosylaminopyrimidine deaminase/5-amino-6-(5-phosphoribosylamino)uracil reductase RibD [Verrucomicrobia bacterium]|nr:bifunctional diaminohydroxyphosphoribosylaminopyrimidine deaminase/5-amino-6-(5-phosphoribosylamino)uracil reductase RibD [Verrucomicrobiota bacterium]MCF7709201.1 bifunctional diaminohydroxyphosphoribosylaminopyrimidine deaminase/5-amino-6-(5-phosphoribosylamino)uracil reductase RibD [Verrucomicrobiota bacterium]